MNHLDFIEISETQRIERVWEDGNVRYCPQEKFYGFETYNDILRQLTNGPRPSLQSEQDARRILERRRQP